MDVSGSGCSSCVSGTGDQIDTVTYPTFKKQFTYDTLGRTLTQTDILSDTDSRVTAFEYDDEGNLIQKTDAMGNDTDYAYDALNRLKIVADPAGGITRYKYDARDNLVSLTDARDTTTRFAYDKANRLVKETRPMGQEIAYIYDENGNLVQKTDAKNQLTAYDYDAANRLVKIHYYADAADTDPTKTVGFTYDNAGNLLTWDDCSASGEFTHDDLNRKLTDTVNFGPFTKNIAYTWAPNSRKSSYTDPSGNVYNYTYVNTQLTGIELPGTGTITTSAYTWTRPATTQYPGGTKQTRTYDPLMRLTGVTDTDPGSNAVMAYAYTHDTLDNITQKSTEHGDYEYGYDTLQRLTSADNPETQGDEAFTYDAVGNRLTDANISDPWSYNQNNELETHDNTSYEYDNNGNMIKKTVNAKTTLFFYNLEDRLEKVADESGNVIATYGYDPFGRRLWKETSGTKTYFMYADEGLVGEYTSTGSEIKTYGWKPHSTWGTDPLFMKIGSKYYFYYNDHLGTPQKMTAVNGAVVWSAKYSSFGDADVEPTSTVENNLRSPGQYFDGETGLHYNWHRYYDPEVGRYLTPDPIGLAGGINPFVYSLNNPINFIDPLGLQTTFTMKSIGGGGFLVSGSLGTAVAMSKTNDGKCYEANYKIISIGFTAGAKIFGHAQDVFDIVDSVLKRAGSAIAGSQFTLNTNYPPIYASYLDIEGPSAAFFGEAKLADMKVGTYENGRADVKPYSTGPTGAFGLQIFKFEGVHLVREGAPKEVCCNE